MEFYIVHFFLYQKNYYMKTTFISLTLKELQESSLRTKNYYYNMVVNLFYDKKK